VRVYLSTGTVDTKHLSHACQHGKSRGRPFSLHISYREVRGKGTGPRTSKAICRNTYQRGPASERAVLVMPASQQNPSFRILSLKKLCTDG
jgi:hypothetical protein